MTHTLSLKKEDDGTYTATIEGILDNEPVISCRCTGEPLAKDAVAKAARVFSLRHQDLGLSIQSVEDLK